jgi:UDP-N-acetylmuramoylalanine--D-glutamate ligase
MSDYEHFFKGKRITVMGIDPEGRGMQDVEFLARHDAEIIATDLKNAEELGSAPEKLGALPNVTLVLGEHRNEDFQDRDLIVRAASVPLGSPYLEEARKHGIRIETDETLFLALAPEITWIGVTGTRGKSTTTELLFEIITLANPGSVHLAGNVRGHASLPLLEKVKEGDVVAFEFSSWQLQQFGEKKLSPPLAIFTTFMPDHLNYYHNDLDRYLADKAQIFLHQEPDDTLIVGSQAADIIKKKYGSQIRSRVEFADASNVPRSWKLQIPGEHNRYNAGCAIEAARAYGIEDKVIRKAVENFKGVPSRLEFMREVDGIKIYNDSNSTTPDATVAALRALDTGKKDIVLIMGGADKGLDMSALISEINERAKAVIFLPGTGTDLFDKKSLAVPYKVANTLEEALDFALQTAQAGDTLLFSPAYASFGHFQNEYDRSDQFRALIQKLK